MFILDLPDLPLDLADFPNPVSPLIMPPGILDGQLVGTIGSTKTSPKNELRLRSFRLQDANAKDYHTGFT